MRTRPSEVAGRGEPQRRLEADPVDDQREQHDADGERPQAHARELAHLRLAEIELLAPRADRERAQDEAERRGDQRGETHREGLPGLG